MATIQKSLEFCCGLELFEGHEGSHLPIHVGQDQDWCRIVLRDIVATLGLRRYAGYGWLNGHVYCAERKERSVLYSDMDRPEDHIDQRGPQYLRPINEALDSLLGDLDEDSEDDVVPTQYQRNVAQLAIYGGLVFDHFRRNRDYAAFMQHAKELYHSEFVDDNAERAFKIVFSTDLKRGGPALVEDSLYLYYAAIVNTSISSTEIEYLFERGAIEYAVEVKKALDEGSNHSLVNLIHWARERMLRDSGLDEEIKALELAAVINAGKLAKVARDDHPDNAAACDVLFPAGVYFTMDPIESRALHRVLSACDGDVSTWSEQVIRAV